MLGGTFDPAHYGHLRLAETAREADRLSLDKVLFIPAGQPWRKSDRVVSHPSHRAAMLGLAIEGNPAFEISTLELEREGPSYTVDTLEILRKHYPDSELFLVIGQDALADLPNWREPDRITTLAWLAVASRSNSSPERLTKPESLPPGARERVLSLGDKRVPHTRKRAQGRLYSLPRAGSSAAVHRGPRTIPGIKSGCGSIVYQARSRPDLDHWLAEAG